MRFTTYHKGLDRPQIEEMAALLIENGIPAEVEEDAPFFEPYFAMNPLRKQYLLKIGQADFPRADVLLSAHAEAEIGQLDPGYFVFHSSDEELLAIVRSPYEWGPLNVRLARKLLQERGVSVDEDTLNVLEQNRLEAMAEPERVDVFWLIFYYFLAVIASPISLFAGLLIAYQTKTLPDGRRVRTYRADHRRLGLALSIISGVCMLLWTYRLFLT